METLPQLEVANADFVTPQLLVGGDLDTRSADLAMLQLAELVWAGVTHLVDVRIEWSDEEFVQRLAPEMGYLHHGMDDIGQEVPPEWFDAGVQYVVDAIEGGGVVLVHCHMGINRGPSLAYAVLLAQGWGVTDALDAIRTARPISFVAYGSDVLRWHHLRRGSEDGVLQADLAAVERWRQENYLDLVDVIRQKREEGF